MASRTLTRLLGARPSGRPPDSGAFGRLLDADALSLGVARAVVCGLFLASALSTDFSALGRLPPTLLRPVGLMQLAPWSLYDALMTPRGMAAFKLLLAAALLPAALGLLTRWTTKASLVLVVFYQGLTRSLGHFNHDELIAVYFLAVLAFSPCGDAFSLDRLRGLSRDRAGGESRGRASGESQPRAPHWAYAYPVLLMRALLAWAYFSSALLKLRAAGAGYFGPDSLPALAVLHSLDNFHETRYRHAFWLVEYRAYTPAAVALVLAWELLFPLALVSKRARWPLLGFGVLFHLASRYLLNVFFPFFMAMYFVYVDWPAVAARLRRLKRRAEPPG